eukprot:CAMPEP_0202897574 /NCGR_PEP_ID=MMETSP1392-20130828/6301_1 /ASSEMBLY_ACC=CAM_ASM_000868 /TAXON_ID=225041 /ORGANISM="Chlamydomonas chlamydogama, Strain SAG 11-48b" /LENGTH=57 /DNA_ID=CAMNT_0049583253 /DNA_START=714 /DNA_END=885 /DNA_ORIENTATION=+
MPAARAPAAWCLRPPPPQRVLPRQLSVDEEDVTAPVDGLQESLVHGVCDTAQPEAHQ